MTELPDYRWAGYSLATKQSWMRQGRGPSAVDTGRAYLSSLATTFGESQRRLRTALAELATAWSGPAASAATESLRTILDRAADLRATADGASTGLGHYGDSFARVQVTIPRLVEPGAQAGAGRAADLTTVGGLHADLRAGPVGSGKADRAANAVLASHERLTREVLTASPTPAVRTAPATADTSPTTAGASSSDDGGRHDQSTATMYPPIIPPLYGAGDHPATRPRAARPLEDTDALFTGARPPTGAEPGGILTPPRPPARSARRPPERRSLPEWPPTHEQPGAPPTPERAGAAPTHEQPGAAPTHGARPEHAPPAPPADAESAEPNMHPEQRPHKPGPHAHSEPRPREPGQDLEPDTEFDTEFDREFDRELGLDPDHPADYPNRP